MKMKQLILGFAAALIVASAPLFVSLAFAQGAAPSVPAPVINDNARTNMDAAKKSVDVERERKRMEEEAAKKKAATSTGK
jgi:hypothetical protein